MKLHWRHGALVCLLALSTLINGCVLIKKHSSNLAPAMTVGVSSDGHYAVSSHKDKKIVLWNLHKQTHRLISDNANIYSAAFAQGRDVFLWQDLDNVVHVENVDGTELQNFKAKPVYSEAMSRDLNTYLMSDGDWRLWLRKDNGDLTKLKEGDPKTFMGLGKPLDVELGRNGEVAVTSGYGAYYHRNGMDIDDAAANGYKKYDGVTAWNLDTKKPIHNLAGNSSKTYAGLSPSGNNAIAVDENGKSFRWSISDGKRRRLSRLGMGIYVGGHDIGSTKNRETSGMHLQKPEDFPKGFGSGEQIAVDFIDMKRYLVFFTYKPYAVMYKVGDPFARKIFKLGKDPFPSVSNYARNSSIDTAPKAGVLVTGQHASGGINVYHFDDSDDGTLERVWAPTP